MEGKAPELWHAGHGADRARCLQHRRRPHDRAARASSRGTPCSSSSGRRPAAPSRTLPRPAEAALASLTGAWDVAFQAGRGAPGRDQRSTPWARGATAPTPGVKYFSGTATYTKTIQAPAEWFKAGREAVARPGRREEYRRGLGQRQAARHLLEDAVPRGRDVGPQAGRQHPGDQGHQPLGQPPDRRLSSPASRRNTPTRRSQFYRADSPLLPSGLLGPVRVVRIE